MKPIKRLTGFTIYLALCGALVWGYWAIAYREALAQLERTGTVQLEQATDRLLGQLERFRQLPGLLADHPLVIRALDPANTPAKTNAFLLRNADLTGASDIYILDKNGTTIASSNAYLPRSFMGQNYAFRPYFQEAINGGLGFFHALGTSSLQRGFFFAGPIRDANAKPIGVIVVKVDIEALETVWRADPQILLFHDENGVVFLSNRSDLIFKMYDYDPALVELLNAQRQYPEAGLSPLPAHIEKTVFGHTLWHIPEHNSFPETSLALTRPVPLIDMTAQIFVNVRDAQEQARFQAMLAAALLAVVSLAFYALRQRRLRLAERLAIEERANSELEQRVERRTEQLHRTQDELVQAGKLTALGEMSAGLSHELNQPLAAIQNFAENGKILLQRNRNTEALENLHQISSLTKRMDRIIQNLRAFARKEDKTVGPVDMVEVINEAVKLVSIRARNEGVTIKADIGTTPVRVMGGGIRLQQVLINLMSNAMDAMQGQEQKTIEIMLEPGPRTTRVSLRDSGPGLNTPNKIFEPFYTTKSVDSGHGLGLGLSISYGIVQSFGGKIKGANHPFGGAIFTMELKTAEDHP